MAVRDGNGWCAYRSAGVNPVCFAIRPLGRPLPLTLAPPPRHLPLAKTPEPPLSPLATLILLTTLIRLTFAWAIGLGVDESYMVSAGRVLSLGYFDHPPAAWWLSWGAAHLFGTEAPIAVRLPFILLFALASWLMARITAHIADERAGFWAAVLLNLSPVFGVTTGTWVLPDGPLDAALLAATLALLRALETGNRLQWAAAGIAAGLALDAKYSAVLTMAGAALYLATDRRWRLRPEPYLAAVLALAVFSPVIVWNATHHWASFAFQGQRAQGLRFQPLAPLTVWAGEALFVLPWIWLPMMVVAVKAARTQRLLVCLAAPPILAFALIAAWSSQRILFHWAAPGYLMLFPLLGEATARHIGNRHVRRTIAVTAALVLAVLTIVGTQERLDWLGGSLPGLRHDPTAEGIDWTSLRADLDARNLLPEGTIVATANWRDAGKIAYALGPGITTLCLNPDSRQFGVAWPPADYAGRAMLLLTVGHPDAAVTKQFAQTTPLPPAPLTLQGRVLEEIAVEQGIGFQPP